ncbi:unnamed protein product, partial [Durusdinium trenchii]
AKKRQRRGRPTKSNKDAGSSGANETAVEDQEAVRLGTTRCTAIRNILRYATKESWAWMTSHVSWCQGYRQSALSDQLLASKFLWPMSPSPPGLLPNEQQEASARMASDMALRMVPEGVKVNLTDFRSHLSVEEHNLLVRKLVAQFEVSVQSLPAEAARSMQRPGLDKLMRSRQVICLWSRCMKGCCEQDLLADDLKSVTQVIEEGDVLDEQVIKSIESFPTHFHVGMVTDLRGAVCEDVDMSQEKAVERAEESLWKARLESFEAHFNKDLLLLKRAMQGHRMLQDKLGWLAHQKRIQQVSVAQRLVQQHMEWCFPQLQTDWSALVGDLQQGIMKPVPTLPPPSVGSAYQSDKAIGLTLARLDMNVPMARNALVVEKYGPLLATLARVHGASNFAVLVVLASRPKEDSTTDVLEDEVVITRKLSQCGFGANIKIIQELSPSAELIDANYLQRDTHVTYKLFMMHDNLKVAFAENKWCASSAVLTAKIT